MPWSKFDAIQNPHDLEVFFDETFPDSVPLIGRELLIQDYFKNSKGSLISVKVLTWSHNILTNLN